VNTWDTGTAYVREYSNLWATALTPEQRDHTCGYWYVVTDGATAHTAFRSREALDTWLRERGLTLDSELPGTWSNDPGASGISGTYRTSSERDRATYDALTPVLATTVIRNGELVEAKIAADGYGVRTVHTMNVNYC